jgi:hypothetical protein
MITFAGLIAVLLGALVVVIEVMPPETGSLKVTNVRSGEGRISTEEITTRLEEEVRALPQIANVQATVRGRGDKAEIDLELHVRPEADLAATTEEACRVARHLVNERMGVQLEREPRAHLHYRELVMAPAAAGVAAGASPPASGPAQSYRPPPAAAANAPSAQTTAPTATSTSVPPHQPPEAPRHDSTEQRPEDRTA